MLQMRSTESVRTDSRRWTAHTATVPGCGEPEKGEKANSEGREASRTNGQVGGVTQIVEGLLCSMARSSNRFRIEESIEQELVYE